MESDSYTLHFQIYVRAVTSAADPTASGREESKGGRKVRNKEGRKQKEERKKEQRVK